MRLLQTLLKATAYLALASLALVVGYVVLMSGIFHDPENQLDLTDYRPADGNILIAGGTRGTGLEIVKQLVAHDENIVVTVRPSSNTAALRALGVETVVMDALDVEQVRAAVSGKTYRAIISTVGTSATDLPTRQNFVQGLIRGQTKMDPSKRPDFFGNRNLIDAAVEFGVTRFVLVTVIGTGNSADALPLPARRGHNEVIPLKAQAEEHLRQSGLDYTIIRPGGLGPRNLKTTGTALLTEDPLAFSYLGRTDLATLTLQTLDHPETYGKTVTAYDPSRRYFWKLFID